MPTFPGYAWIVERTRDWAERRRLLAKVRSGQPSGTQDEMSRFLGAQVHLQDGEIAALQRYAAGASGPLVEIGAAFGGSALAFLLRLRPGNRLCSIDPFVKDSMADFQASAAQCRRGVTCALRRAGLAQRAEAWTLIPDYSYNAVKNFSGGIALLFIDGDHRYDAVKRDFFDWLPLVSQGGLILLHDSRQVPGTPPDIFNQGWPGPTRLAQELKKFPKVTLLEEVESLSVYRKIDE